MPGKIQCACGKQYTWKPELAGKRAKCKACGSVVSFPASDPDDATPTVVTPRASAARPAAAPPAATARPAAASRAVSSTAAPATLKAPSRPAAKAPAEIPPPPPPPPRDDIPEGFEDMYDPSNDAPPPPPPPPVGASSFASSSAHSPPVAIKGAKSIGGSDSTGGGFKFTWGAAFNMLLGLGAIGFAVMEYFLISDAEAHGLEPKFGRRSGLTRLIYGIAGKWGVATGYTLLGLALIVGGLLVMLGKTKPAESND